MTRGERAREVVERRGVRLAFAWGFAEATLFFVVPDVAVGGVALFGLRRGLRAAAAVVAGAVLGGAATYLAARWAGPAIRDVFDALPAIPARFFPEAREGIAASGGTAVVTGPSRGIPYKVYAAEWALGGHAPAALLLWTVPARAARIVPVALLCALAGRVWERVLGREWAPLLLVTYAAVWLGIYVAYFVRIGLY